MVDRAGPDLSRSRSLCRLFDLGRVSGRALYVRALSFADVFAAHLGSGRPDGLGTFVAGDVAGVDTDVDPYDAGPFDPLGTGRVSVYLLLLSRCLLQVVLGRPPGMRRRRASLRLSG